MLPRRILVIEDEPDIRGLLRVFLESEGYLVDTVDKPSETVATLLVQRYDLITIDLRMPEMDGTDVAILAKSVDNQVPVIIISGYLTPDRMVRFQNMGIRYFVHKPFQKTELIDIVKTALRETGRPTA